MDVFELRNRLGEGYAQYTRSLIKIADRCIREKADGAINDGALWPEPLFQLSPTSMPGGTVNELVAEGTFHPEGARIFRKDKPQT